MDDSLKKEEINKIRKEIEKCQKCPLFKTRLNPVIGEGSLSPKIMFIGEAPGANEDKQGIPFCGRAGKILDELLESINLKREEVYITNIVKCRPPNNRNPLADEIESCSSFLDRQIEIIKPNLIATLGNFSSSYILKKLATKKEVPGISKIHGKVFLIKHKEKKVFIVPLYHPAVATYNPNTLPTLKKDFYILKLVLERKIKGLF